MSTGKPQKYDQNHQNIFDNDQHWTNNQICKELINYLSQIATFKFYIETGMKQNKLKQELTNNQYQSLKLSYDLQLKAVLTSIHYPLDTQKNEAISSFFFFKSTQSFPIIKIQDGHIIIEQKQPQPQLMNKNFYLNFPEFHGLIDSINLLVNVLNENTFELFKFLIHILMQGDNQNATGQEIKQIWLNNTLENEELRNFTFVKTQMDKIQNQIDNPQILQVQDLQEKIPKMNRTTKKHKIKDLCYQLFLQQEYLDDQNEVHIAFLNDLYLIFIQAVEQEGIVKVQQEEYI